MEPTADEKEEARLLSAISKAKSGSLGRAVKAPPKNRPSPVVLPAPVTSPAKPSIPAPAPSAFVRSPSQNFGNPNPTRLPSTSSMKSPTATSSPSAKDPAQSPRTPSAHSFALSPRNFNSPQAVASPPIRSPSSGSLPGTQSPSTQPVRSTSHSYVPNTYQSPGVSGTQSPSASTQPVRSTSHSYGLNTYQSPAVSGTQSPSSSTQPVRSTSHTYVPNTYQSPSQILSRTPSEKILALSSSSVPPSPTRAPSVNGFPNGSSQPSTPTSQQTSAPVPKIERSSSQIALSLPSSRSSTNVTAQVSSPAITTVFAPASAPAPAPAPAPATTAPAPAAAPAQPLQRTPSNSSSSAGNEQGIPSHLKLSFKELDALLEDNKKNYPAANANVAPRTHSTNSLSSDTDENPVIELDNLISDLRAAAAPPPHLAAAEDDTPAPATTSSSASATSASTKSSTSTTSERTTSSSSLPRGYGSTFTSLMEFVEQNDTNKQPPAEYPTPVPSSRLNNTRKFSIPPRPAHEDSSESLLERKLIGEASPVPKPRSGLSSVSSSPAHPTTEASASLQVETESADVHPAFQSTYDSINNMLADPLSPTAKTTRSAAFTSESSTTSTTAHKQTPAPIITKTNSFSSATSSTNSSAPVTPSTVPNTPTTAASSAPPTPSTIPNTPSTVPNTPSTVASSAYSSFLNTPVYSSTPKAPTYTPTGSANKPNPLDSVGPMLAALEERTREDVPRTPTAISSHPQPAGGNTPVLAPITNSSREIRTALEVYQPETVCAGCDQSIQGRHLLALNKHWHNEHLQCVLCYKPLLQYAEYNDKPYCGPCYTKNFLAPRCVACGDNIMKEMVEALGGQYHVDCFKCAECNEVFPEGIFVESKVSSKVYCERCYYKVEGKQCAKCSQPITDTAFTEIMGKSLHKQCFKCFGCETPFTSMECYPVNDMPYCYDCAAART